MDEATQTELEALYVTFAREILLKARQVAELSAVPQIIPWQPGLTRILQYKQLVTLNDYESLVSQVDAPDIWQSEAIRSCVRAHWHENIITYPKDWEIRIPDNEDEAFEQWKHMAYRQLILPLAYTMEQSDTLAPSDPAILDAYRLHRDQWMASHLRFKTVVPLFNFTTDVNEEIQLTSRLRLSPLEEFEKRRPLSKYAYTMDMSGVAQASFALIYTNLQDRHASQRTPPDFHGEIEDWVTALRLLKPGEVAAPIMLNMSEVRSIWQPSVEVFVNHELGTDYWFVGATGQGYHLAQHEVAGTIELFSCLRNMERPHRRGLRAALKRWNIAYSREDDEERVTDLTISLESALLSGSPKSEISYRFILRGAAMAAHAQPPEAAASLLEVMYMVRSKVVHEGKLLVEVKRKELGDRTPTELIRDAGNIARLILREYVLRLGKSQQIADVKSLNAELEKRIRAGLAHSV